jgi:hypothetical protein
MSIPTQIAETVQTAHIQRDPSPHHDANPSTSASTREPVRLESLQKRHRGPDDDDEEEDDDDIAVVADSDDEGSDIPVSVLRPHRRRHDFPPMPDLRFEQSYLHSIEGAEGRWGKIAWITVRDQVRKGTIELLGFPDFSTIAKREERENTKQGNYTY